MATGYANIPGYGAVNWKAPVADVAALPASSNLEGDARVVLSPVSIYVWGGSSWTEIAGGGGGGGVTSLNALDGDLDLVAGDNMGAITPSGTTITIDGGGIGAVDWSSRRLLDVSTIPAVDWATRLLTDVSGGTKVSWATSELVDSSTTLDWSQGILYFSGITSIHWGLRNLVDSNNVIAGNWDTKILLDAGGTTSLAWQDRVGRDLSSAISFNWDQRILVDASNIESVNWAARYLRDSGGTVAMDFASRYFADTSGTPVINYGGSQVLGFFNVTPAVRPSTSIGADSFQANSSAIADDSATFGGYTLGQIVACLKSIGLLS